MSKSYLTQCPRCGTRSYEQLQTHGHCIECLYSTDLAPNSSKRNFLTLREAEALIEPSEVRQMRRDQKKVSEAAS
jgi:ribosomal protein L37E